MEGYDLQIEVSSEQGTATSDGGLLSLSGTFRTYTCTMRYEPWPSSLEHRRRFAGGTGKVVARARSDGRSVASGGGYVTAASSYIAYARALNRLGWTPAEFVVAESFAVRLRGMLGRRPVRADCRLSWRFRAVPRFTPALWPIPSTSLLSTVAAMSSSATKTSALGVCVPARCWGGAPTALRNSRPLFRRTGAELATQVADPKLGKMGEEMHGRRDSSQRQKAPDGKAGA